MPFTINGFGTGIYGSRGKLKWFGSESFDGVEFICAAFVPLIPIKAIHTFDWNGQEFRQIPIRMSGGLLMRCWWVSFAFGVMLAGAAFLVFAGVAAFDRQPKKGPPFSVGVIVLSAVGGLATIGAGYGLLRLHNHTDQRDQNIRRVMGPHFAGSSDPATWTETLMQGLRSPQEAHGAPTYLHAAMQLFQQRRFSDAMMCARIAIAQGETEQGEEMTSAILNEPDVILGLRQVTAVPDSWPRVFGGNHGAAEPG